MDERSIYRYKKQYNRGLEHLLTSRYKGRCPKLSPKQELELSRHLEKHLYNSSKEILVHIKNTYPVDFTQNGLVITLHRLGFSYKKTKAVPCKANRDKHVEVYRNLRKNLCTDEKIYFMDAVHPTHNVMPAYGWIKKGTEKEVKSNTGRQRLNINGVYSPIDQEIIIREN